MNNEKKQAPRCPYCGAEMRIEKPIFANEYDYDASLVGAKAGWCTQATCTKCWSVAPFVYGTETEKDAYEVVREKAMRRWQEPNRVLTLDELKHYNGFIWCESRDGEVFEPGWVEDMYAYGRGCETINLCNENIDWSKGRCWLRKPTEQEMENTPWEDEGR